ncbi:MAG: DNRLRE domain-containing protein [Chloroflexi bacterium]|nr:DNRLRE domain-containing protein [Chloroflexota bacterium]
MRNRLHTDRPALRARLLLGLLLLVGIGWLAIAAGAGARSSVGGLALEGLAEGPASFPPYSDRWRIGFGCANQNGYVNEYDISRLCAGWYHSWGRMQEPPRPGGIDYIQHIRVSPSHYDLAHPQAYNWDGLQRTIEANPGAIWVIGNEPDGRAPDACDQRTPDEYARIYKRFYDFIKGVDPTAQVAFGPIIQATPVRIQWLNLTWEAYRSRYGTDMPVDVWTVHNQIVKEAPDQGADIPPGCDPALGRNYGIQDNDNLALFIEHMVRMRQWMKNHGQRNKPLYLTEYGVLQPEYEGFTSDRINEYMDATFTWMLHATDPSLGMPDDGNRLVQRWAWFALNVPQGRLGQQGGWNGSLFDPATREITEVGRNFGRWACAASHPSPTPNTTPPRDPILREVERGSTHGLMARGEHNSASDCRFVHIDPQALTASPATDEGAEVVLNVYIPNTGRYAIWGRGKGIDYLNRSFNLRVAAYPWEAWYFGTGGWNWQKAPTGEGYYLEGRRWHTIRIGTRGGGQAQMDLLVVTANLSYNPNNDPSLIQICNPTPTCTPTRTRTPTTTPTPTITRTPMPTGPGRIAGSVRFEGAGTPPAPAWARTLQVSAHLPGDPVPAYEFDVHSDEMGGFLVPSGVLTGTYDVGVRDRHSLRNLRRDVDVSLDTPPLDMGQLHAGDANGDNQINIYDFSLLATHYGQQQGQPGYDERPDFNHDGVIGIHDFSLLATNYGRTGDVVLGGEASGRNLQRPSAHLLGNVTIYVVPANKTALVGEAFVAEVYLNAGSNEVNTAEVAMTFNPSYLHVMSINPDTSGLNQVLYATYDNANGTISYSAARLTSPPSAKTGTFKLFTLQLRAQAPVASTSLAFGAVTVLAPGAAEHSVAKQGMTLSVPAATSTPTPTNTPVATAVPSPTATNTPAAGVYERVFQQGLNGYSVFEDTTLDAWDPDMSYHADHHLRLRSPDVRRILLRVDISILPPGTLIEEATLLLYQGSGSPNPLTARLYRVLRPWVHGQATWNEARQDLDWAQGGCGGMGTDRAAELVDEKTIFPTFGSYENYPFAFDITPLVQLWVNNPGANQGVIIDGVAGSAIEFVFRSSEYFDPAFRPRLVVRYRTGTPGPTPSPTATQTARPEGTPSPTASPTATRAPSGLASVESLTFLDRNGDGAYQPGEPAVQDVSVELQGLQGTEYRQVCQSAADGRCFFADLQAGAYRLRIIGLPWGYRWSNGYPYYLSLDLGAALRVEIPLSRQEILTLPLVRGGAD